MSEHDLESQAMTWVVKLTDRNLSPQEWQDFETWRAQGPEQQRAYEAALSTWRGAGNLQVPDAVELLARHRQVTPDVALERSSRNVSKSPWVFGVISWRAVAATVAASLVVTLLSLTAWKAYSSAPDIYRTRVGEVRSITLADGTEIRLNTSTEVRVRLGRSVRDVEMLRGEVLFSIAPDPRRPFQVKVGGETVRVLGTRFSARLQSERDVELIVEDGRVGVGCPSGVSSFVSLGRTGCFVELAKGDDLVIESGRARLARLSTEEVQRRLSWVSGWLSFNGTEPFSEVVRQFNRYSPVQLQVGDPRAANIRFGGAFRTGDVDEFVKTLKPFHLHPDPTVTDPNVIRLVGDAP